MKRLTISEINTLAELPLMDPLLNAFRTRMLITYAVGLGYVRGASINGNDIQNGWLIVKDELLSLTLEKDCIYYIPLHPIICKIFEAYSNNIPTFDREDIYLLKLAAEMRKHSSGKLSEWKQRLVFTFQWSGCIKEMQALGIPLKEAHVLTGRSSRHTYPVIGPEIKELFFNDFFDFFIPLAAQYGIDWPTVMGL